MREYPKVLSSWKRFSAYQANTKKNRNAEKTARAAVDIVLNYINICENKDVDLKLILDGKILNEMLVLFQERKDLSCETKLKYLNY